MSNSFIYVIVVILICVGTFLFAWFGPCVHFGEFDAYCSLCGVQLRKICPECDNTFKLGSFCPSCGFNLEVPGDIN